MNEAKVLKNKLSPETNGTGQEGFDDKVSNPSMDSNLLEIAHELGYWYVRTEKEAEDVLAREVSK